MKELRRDAMGGAALQKTAEQLTEQLAAAEAEVRASPSPSPSPSPHPNPSPHPHPHPSPHPQPIALTLTLTLTFTVARMPTKAAAARRGHAERLATCEERLYLLYP